MFFLRHAPQALFRSQRISLLCIMFRFDFFIDEDVQNPHSTQILLLNARCFNIGRIAVLRIIDQPAAIYALRIANPTDQPFMYAPTGVLFLTFSSTLSIFFMLISLRTVSCVLFCHEVNPPNLPSVSSPEMYLARP